MRKALQVLKGMYDSLVKKGVVIPEAEMGPPLSRWTMSGQMSTAGMTSVGNTWHPMCISDFFEEDIDHGDAAVVQDSMLRVYYVRKQPFDHGLIDWRIFCCGQVRKRPKRASWPGVGTARSISLSRTLAGSWQPQMQLTSCGVTVDMKKHYNHFSTASRWSYMRNFMAALRVQNQNTMIVEPQGGIYGVVSPYSTQPPQGPHQSSEKEANGQSTRSCTKANAVVVEIAYANNIQGEDIGYASISFKWPTSPTGQVGSRIYCIAVFVDLLQDRGRHQRVVKFIRHHLVTNGTPAVVLNSLLKRLIMGIMHGSRRRAVPGSESECVRATPQLLYAQSYTGKTGRGIQSILAIAYKYSIEKGHTWQRDPKTTSLRSSASVMPRLRSSVALGTKSVTCDYRQSSQSGAGDDRAVLLAGMGDHMRAGVPNTEHDDEAKAARLRSARGANVAVLYDRCMGAELIALTAYGRGGAHVASLELAGAIRTSAIWGRRTVLEGREECRAPAHSDPYNVNGPARCAFQLSEALIHVRTYLPLIPTTARASSRTRTLPLFYVQLRSALFARSSPEQDVSVLLRCVVISEKKNPNVLDFLRMCWVFWHVSDLKSVSLCRLWYILKLVGTQESDKINTAVERRLGGANYSIGVRMKH
ncbi:hypothetical protein C8R45DRAFT_933944 [Mycena sanguinolenta]|nr:hypothetical protein C8R45DRAFT_933944 [Mycena sanguinolenta]